ncbi:MAG TPA: hypothetical protein VHN18_10590, partial [Micromonosporaceae bacterium]|nr:hypothetical protein [Micromonosporaceae bacterium]
RRAPKILAALTTAASDAADNPNAVWDNEGGHISPSRPHRRTPAEATAIRSYRSVSTGTVDLVDLRLFRPNPLSCGLGEEGAVMTATLNDVTGCGHSRSDVHL